MENPISHLQNLKYLTSMEVIKRDGRREKVSFDKIIARIEGLCERLNLNRIDPIDIAKSTVQGLYNGVTTEELDCFAANKCAERIIDDPQYNRLAAGLCISNLHKNTSENFLEVTDKLFKCDNPLISQSYHKNVCKYSDKIQAALDYSRDYYFDFFAIKTLERAYLIRMKNSQIDLKDQENKRSSSKLQNEKVLRLRYGYIVERPQHMFMRVAIAIHGDDIDSALDTYNLMSSHYFIHATPTLYNAGSIRQQLSSCFLLHMTDDIDGIFKTISDTAKISKWAGGIGIDIAKIRGSGSIIRGTNGNSDGIIPLIRVLNDVGKYINQSGRRNGAIAVYIEPWHVDIYDFCDLRRNTGTEDRKARDIFLALWIPDLFMKRVEEDGYWSLMCPDECPKLTDTYGDEFERIYTKYEEDGRFRRRIKASDLWFHILSAQIETGMPYMTYKDNVNRLSNQKNIGIIRSSNLCVSGETYILTDKGQIQIKQLVNETVNVWNGFEWSSVTVIKTGMNKEVMKIEFSNGVELKCTPEHKFYLNGGSADKRAIMVPAKDLRINNKLIKYDLPEPIRINNNCSSSFSFSFKYPYTHGFFCGEGTNFYNYSETGKYPKAYLYGEKKKLLNKIKYESYSDNKSSNTYDLVLPKNLAPKFEVPLQHHKDIKLEWLAGYSDAEGKVVRNGTDKSLLLGSTEKDFLMRIKLMLQTLGIDSKVTLNKDAHQEYLPDGKDRIKLYDFKDDYRLLISSNDLYELCKLGFKTYHLKFKIKTIKPQLNVSQFIKVKNITKLDKKEDTYCFSEPKRHMGMFNGILTGQCSEIVEYTSKDEIAVCNLGSICLPKFVEKDSEGKLFYNFQKLFEVAKVLTKNLNNIIDINYYPVPETERSNFKHRPIGVGVQGLTDTYCIMDLSFDSEEAGILNKKIFETIYFGCLTSSNELAQKYGPYQTFEGSPFSQGLLQYHLWGLSEKDLLMDWNWGELIEKIKKYGIRNSLLTALMPTASTSQIMNNVESFEPLTTNLYTRTTLAGEYVIINKHLVEKLISLNLWTKNIREEFLFDNGSIQKIQDIPDDIKAVYKTASEMRMKPIIKQAIERGPFIDQSQSMNLFCNVPDFDALTSAHFYGWRNKLKTGMYYLRSQPAVDPIKFGLELDVVKRIKKRRANNKGDSDDDGTGLAKDIKDPRRISEIELNLQKGDQRNSSFGQCEMCSG